MAIKFLSDVTLEGNKLSDFLIGSSDNDMENYMDAGRVYFNYDEEVFKFCDGNKWITLGAAQSQMKFSQANISLTSANSFKQTITAATHGVKSKFVVQVYENVSGVLNLVQTGVSIAANGDVTVEGTAALTGVVMISGSTAA